jgi:catechol 2,3-dioxygenase-like lactoylglutathione lyase family enzyme
MRIIKLAWVGTRTANADETFRFFRDVLGLRLDHMDRDFWVLTLPDGAKVEVFGPQTGWNPHFTTCPVAGFLVDDVQAATEELRQAGTEIVHGPRTMGDNTWVHFRAPDGNIYELTQDPGVDRSA